MSPAPQTTLPAENLRRPFGSCVFLWGTCFISMYGRYASHLFPFIGMLDNFYAKQDSDGSIPRQIDILDGRSAFEKNGLSSTGGNLLAWAEWRNYAWTGDAARLARVHPRLLAFHRWLRRHRTSGPVDVKVRRDGNPVETTIK